MSGPGESVFIYEMNHFQVLLFLFPRYKSPLNVRFGRIYGHILIRNFAAMRVDRRRDEKKIAKYTDRLIKLQINSIQAQIS